MQAYRDGQPKGIEACTYGIGKIMSEQWLKCQVFKGMFSDEKAVLYRFGQLNVSVFVPKDCVEVDAEPEGRVKVRVFERDGTVWAVFPNSQSAVAAVNNADLVPA
jgi:hypothetical protein